MLRRDITYENPLTDEKVTETHYFHISKTDLVEMEIEEHGRVYMKDGEELTGARAKLQRISDAEDGKAIMAEIKDFVRRSYGVNDDGRWRKSREIQDEFMASEAFGQLFFELCTDMELSAQFMEGIMPKNLAEIAAEVQEQAERIRAGREAQAAAKSADTPEEAKPAPAEGQLSPGTAAVMEAATPPENFGEQSLASKIENATPENPATLTPAEVDVIDSDELKSGLATGRLKIS